MQRILFFGMAIAIAGCGEAPPQPSDMAAVQDLQMPDLQKPDLKMPDLKMPDLQMPDLQMPDLQMPDLQMPDLQMPDLKMPDLQMPDLQMPDLLPIPPYFSSPSTLQPGGVGPKGIVAGKFDGDNNWDVAVAWGDTVTGGVTVFRGAGDGQFFAGKTFGTGGFNCFAVQTANFNNLSNNDTNADLVVVNRSSSNVGILFGDGTGSFGAATNVTTSATPNDVIVGDFTNDSPTPKQDVLVVTLGGKTIDLLVGDGLGGFAAAKSFSLPNLGKGVVAGDFNSDGWLDVAATCQDKNVYIFINNKSANGDFVAGVAYGNASLTAPKALATADIDKDGILDLIVPNSGSDVNGNPINTVSIFKGNGSAMKGNGTFADPFTLGTVSNNPNTVRVGDFNKDGKLDFVTANGGGYNMSLFLGTGGGSFAVPPSTFSLGKDPEGLTVADFNNDGKLDVASANNGNLNDVSILLNQFLP